MNLTELHPAFTIRQAGAGFVVNHWEQPGGAIGMIMRTEARCWELTLTTTAALLLALILLPLLVLLWASESRQQRARRWRRAALTQQAIADRLGCSRSTVRRLLAT